MDIARSNFRLGARAAIHPLPAPATVGGTSPLTPTPPAAPTPLPSVAFDLLINLSSTSLLLYEHSHAASRSRLYGTFRHNFHRFDRLELDLRGHTQP